MVDIIATLRSSGPTAALDETTWAIQRRLYKAFPWRRFHVGSYSLRFDLRTAGGPKVWRWLQTTASERNAIQVLESLAANSQTVLDVGAWVGTHTLVLAKSMRGGRVLAFEPDPLALCALRRHVRANALTNVEILPLAVSNQSGTVKLCASARWGLSESSLTRFADYAESSRIVWQDVKAVSLDDYCASNCVRPDGIKMDIEGGEALAIAGALRVIRECHPWLLIEFHGDFMPSSRADELYSFLLSIAHSTRMIRAADPGLQERECPRCRPQGIFQMLLCT